MRGSRLFFTPGTCAGTLLIGYVEIALALIAMVGDAADMYDTFKENERRNFRSAVLLFLPAFTDALLAALDFFIFTTSASEDSARVRASILERSNVWCVTLTAECYPIVVEEATRENGAPPAETQFTEAYIAFGAGFAGDHNRPNDVHAQRVCEWRVDRRMLWHGASGIYPRHDRDRSRRGW